MKSQQVVDYENSDSCPDRKWLILLFSKDLYLVKLYCFVMIKCEYVWWRTVSWFCTVRCRDRPVPHQPQRLNRSDLPHRKHLRQTWTSNEPRPERNGSREENVLWINLFDFTLLQTNAPRKFALWTISFHLSCDWSNCGTLPTPLVRVIVRRGN